MYSGEYNVVDVTLICISTGRGFDSHRGQATFQPARRGYTLRVTSKTFLLIISFAFNEI
jgi:hypothetical protein